MSNLKERLQQIKDDYAKELYFPSWDEMCIQISLRVGSSFGKMTEIEKYQDEICKRYAEEVIKESSERAATEEAHVRQGNSLRWTSVVDKQSILKLIEEL